MQKLCIALLFCIVSGRLWSQGLNSTDSILFRKIVTGIIVKDTTKMTRIYNGRTGTYRYRPRFLSKSGFDSLYKPIFSKDQWQQGLTLTFGFTTPQRKALAYKIPKDYDTARQRFKTTLLRDIYDILQKDSQNRVNLNYIDSSLAQWSYQVDSIYKKITLLTRLGISDYNDLCRI